MNIIKTILKNKERIKYEYYQTSFSPRGGYYLFKFYLDKRNIFGFKKYIEIRYYSRYPNYIDIIAPNKNDIISIKNKKLSAELVNIYTKYREQEKLNTINNIIKVLDKNIRRI